MIKTDDLILWESNNSLQINDFKALQKDTVKTGGKKFLGAISSISIEVLTTQKNKFTAPKMVVKNYFHRDQSWMMVKNAYVLQHEQIHFNISELYARKIRKSADSLARKKVTNLQTYRNIVEHWEKKKQKANDQFDAENEDYFFVVGKEILFRKNPKQKEWLDKINAELQKLDIYKYENSL
jgi:hypothetical protein